MKFGVLPIIIIAVIAYFIISRVLGGSKSKKSKSNKLKVSDFVPNEQQENGTWCSKEDALECLEIFSKQSGVDTDELNELFNGCYSRTMEHLKDLRRENDKELEEHVAHENQQIEKIKADDNEAQEDIDYHVKAGKDEIKDYEKSHAKFNNWIDKQEEKLSKDCRKILRHTLKTFTVNEYGVMEEELYPEPPDSLYW